MRKEQGSASVEFVLLFPALFLILYAIVTYGLIFGAQHTMALAAAEGGRAALRYQNAADSAQALAQRMDAARAAAARPLAWLQAATGSSDPQPVVSSVACTENTALTCITVRIAYDYRAAPLIPSLLPVPATLSSESVVQLSPLQLL
ncbi:TadE/TadG family type IV pilus assembly protein [Xenophilus sp. Marseille-Q4582]|uniref:TadE/TadG family type IV pilus assembly protein n=1 Tax=Xenophilus sp. Marseille-Q4582 TaxID=2866600 RepID=UPI001CE3C35B|nr:TadE/TadG family type IV pilus assembly protein [Xenophilus sp. Marseille-Q4582]